MKVLRRSLATDATAAKRFVREARLAARIKHPNVVAIHRVGELRSDGRPYLVMEYVDGQTFDDVLAAQGRCPSVRSVASSADVCKALAAAHALGIIHRDIRPGNIMRIRDGGRIVLTDFGLTGILVATVSLGLLSAWALTGTAPSPPPLRLSVLLPEPQRGVLGTMALSADGSTFVYEGPGAEGSHQLWIRNWSEFHASPLSGTDRGCFSPHHVAEGDAVLFTAAVGDEWHIRAVDLSTNRLRARPGPETPGTSQGVSCSQERLQDLREETLDLSAEPCCVAGSRTRYGAPFFVVLSSRERRQAAPEVWAVQHTRLAWR